MAHFSRHIYGGRCCRGHRFRYFPMETIHPHWSLLGELLTSPNTASMWTFFVMTTACDLRVLSVQMADAMEMMILSILAPQLHCEWRLLSLEVALLTSVMVLWHLLPNVHAASKSVIIVLCLFLQAVFIGMMISSSLWGNISDRYGRKTVSFPCLHFS